MSQSVWLGCVKSAVKATPPPLGSGLRAFLCVSASFEEFCVSSKAKKYQGSGLLFFFVRLFVFVGFVFVCWIVGFGFCSILLPRIGRSFAYIVI